ncbi:heparan sulfate glucosamine 3-O-sulfotransferase 3B1-like [Amphiura filiformis]|uniref:heparan sulfate glucosamine 3-O-sulfotransferase 3B1-like n=1 Tax=Amphiura filiformis TaxID=82378 RepID=UPI003B221C4B
MKSLETRRTTNLITARTYTSLFLFTVIVCLLPTLILLCWTQYMYKDPLQSLATSSEYNVKERSSSLVNLHSQPTWDTSCYSYHRKKHLKSQRKLREMGCDRKLPKALIIGVKKCGTITLTQFLDLHPEIETISGISFNPRVFVRDWVKQMPMSTSEQITVVDSPGYIDNPETLQYMVSNPCFENVDRNRVLIVDGDAFKTYPLLALKQVETFLGLSDFFTDRHFYFNSRKGFFCANVTDRPDTKCMTPNKGRSHPTVHQNLLQQMSDFFTPYNLKLQEYLNQTLTFSKMNVLP